MFDWKRKWKYVVFQRQMRMVVVFVLAHCDKLLRWGGVNGNGFVKVCFSCTHFDCNSETLQHLVTAQALHVQAHHLEKGHKTVFENSLQLLMFIGVRFFVKNWQHFSSILLHFWEWKTPTFSSLPTHTSFMMHWLFLLVMAWYIGVKEVL